MVILYVTLYVLGWLITAALIADNPDDNDKLFGIIIVSGFLLAHCAGVAGGHADC